MRQFANTIVKFFARAWNAVLAAVSLVGLAVVQLVPPWQAYTRFFLFLAANAIVWTLIEIKSDLTTRATVQTIFRNMREARPSIVSDIEHHLKDTTPDQPLHLLLLGGRIRSMSDVIRELADDLRSEKARGYADIQLHCLDPKYIADRILPGSMPIHQQRNRNASYGVIIENITREMIRLSGNLSARSAISIDVINYREDPHCYCYLIGDDLIYWGTFTWTKDGSDFVGPENPCYRLEAKDPLFPSIRRWLVGLGELHALEMGPTPPFRTRAPAAGR